MLTWGQKRSFLTILIVILDLSRVYSIFSFFSTISVTSLAVALSTLYLFLLISRALKFDHYCLCVCVEFLDGSAVVELAVQLGFLLN